MEKSEGDSPAEFGAGNLAAGDTLALARELTERAWALRAQSKALEEQHEALKEQYNETLAKLQQLLRDNGQTRFDIKECTALITSQESVNCPKEPERREKLFGYLREKGIYDEMVTVNQKTLTAWRKREVEAAIERGAFDFEVPGLEGKVFQKEIVQLRKK